MKGTRLLPLALLVLSCAGRKPATSAEADFERLLSQQGVDAVLWQATSAEARRLYQQCFELARIRLDENLQHLASMPPAVIVDVDETVLDNSPYEIGNIMSGAGYDSAGWTSWVNEAKARALPGAVDFLKYAESRGCEIFYVTNRERHHRTATVANLKKEGFPMADDAHVLPARGGSDKTERRTAIGFTYDIRLLVGDQLRDFNEVFRDRVIDNGWPKVDAMRDTLSQYFILLPNPMYGTWRDAISGKGTDQEKYDKVMEFFQKTPLMRAVIQRVSEASVHIADEQRAAIPKGLLVLVGVEVGDTEKDVEWLCGKIARMRIFPDEAMVMNLDIAQADGEILLVSQFTLHASTAKGNRPSYIRAARPEEAVPLYLRCKQRLGELTGRPVKTGEFGADMQVELVNDGPVTIVIDSRTEL